MLVGSCRVNTFPLSWGFEAPLGLNLLYSFLVLALIEEVYFDSSVLSSIRLGLNLSIVIRNFEVDQILTLMSLAVRLHFIEVRVMLSLGTGLNVSLAVNEVN